MGGGRRGRGVEDGWRGGRVAFAIETSVKVGGQSRGGWMEESWGSSSCREELIGMKEEKNSGRTSGKNESATDALELLAHCCSLPDSPWKMR